jgi:ABC-type sugar transport system substrate-binding protein
MRLVAFLIPALAWCACTRAPTADACRFHLVKVLGEGLETAAVEVQLARELPQSKNLHLLVCGGDRLTMAALGAAAGAEALPLIGVDVSPAAAGLMSELQQPWVALVSLLPREAAVELALLRCYGYPVPESLEFGPRLWTRNNAAAGGEDVPSPASFALAALRHQHAGVLAGPPPSDVVFRFGMVESVDPSIRTEESRALLAKAVASHSQIYWDHRQVVGEKACQAALAFFRSENFNAILVACDGPEIAQVCDAAVEQGIVVVKLGREPLPTPGALWIGIDQGSWGRGLAQAMVALMPAGGRIFAAESREHRLDWATVEAVLGSEFCR